MRMAPRFCVVDDVPMGGMLARGSAQQPVGQRRVLVVDDHAELRTAVREMLEGEGYAVEEAGDGPRALALLESGGFDAAVVDVRLPGMDGFALLAEAGRRGVACPTVLMSVVADAESARRATALGAVSLHAKPFVLEQLLEDVRTAASGDGLRAPS
jgi:CheY-like chemotaxis protein